MPNHKSQDNGSNYDQEKKKIPQNNIGHRTTVPLFASQNNMVNLKDLNMYARSDESKSAIRGAKRAKLRRYKLN